MSQWKSIRIAQLSTQILRTLTEDARPESMGGKGGFSISIRGANPQTGYMISDFGSEKLHPFNVLRPHLSVPDLRAFIKQNHHLLKPAEKFFGGWLNADGKLALDVSSNIGCDHPAHQPCEHRWNAYLSMIKNKQDAVYDINGEKFLSATEGKSEYPDYTELFEKHEQDMAKYRGQAQAKLAAQETSAPGKHYFRIGPDATDEELLDIINKIAGN